MIDAALFDLGKVLLDWDPRYYYARHFPDDPAGLERFVGTVVDGNWIKRMDAGLPAAEAIRLRQAEFPADAPLIALWSEGWPQMLRGEIAGTAHIVHALKRAGKRLYALTNFSTETFPVAQARCPTLRLFERTVMSGEIGLVKPDPRIYAHTTRVCALQPQSTLFIDDLEVNVEAARRHGWQALQFTGPQQLAADLLRLGVLDGWPAGLDGRPAGAAD